MMLGLNEQRMYSAINSYLSHIQVHHPSFTENLDIEHTIVDYNFYKNFKKTEEIKYFSSRTIVSAMASTVTVLESTNRHPNAEKNQRSSKHGKGKLLQ